MSQRGSVVAYLLFSIALSIGAGYVAYAWIRDHKPTESPPTKTVIAVSPPRPVPVPQPPPEVEPQHPVVAAPPISIAEQRAVNPIVDPDYTSSPIMGIPGIEGSITRGAVDRRFRAKSVELQHCWEENGDSAATIHATLHIDAAGRVTSANVSSGLSSGAEACVLAVFSSISFSAPGKPAEVVLPIAFR